MTIRRPAAAASLALFVVVTAAWGGRHPVLWPAAAALLLALGAALLAAGPGASRLALHPFAPGAAGFLVWGAVSAFRAPCAGEAWSSLAAFAAALSFGAAACLRWADGERLFFERFVAAAAAAQGALVLAGKGSVFPGNPQYGAFWMTAGALLAAHRAFSTETAGRADRSLWGAAALLAAAGTLGSSSRSGILGLAAGGLVWTGLRFGRRALLAALLASTVALGAALVPGGPLKGLLKERDAQAWKRPEIWKTALAGVAEKPLLGWGPGGFEVLYRRHARPQADRPARYELVTGFAHNDYLQAAAEWGVPAAVFLLWGAGALLFRRRRDPVDAGRDGAVAGAAVFALVNFPFALPACALLAAGTAGSSACGETPSAEKPLKIAAAALGLLALTQAAAAVSAATGRPGLFSPRTVHENALVRAETLLHERNDAAAAEALLGEIVRACPARAAAWAELAHVADEHAVPPRLAEARDRLARAVELQPSHAPWRLALARLLEREGNVPGALEAARETLRREPLYADAALEIGRLLRLSGRPAHGERWLAALLARGPAPGLTGSAYEKTILTFDPEAVRLELALCRLGQKKFAAALETAAALAPGKTRLSLEAEVLFRSGRKRESLAKLEQALALDPADARLKEFLEAQRRK